MTQGVTALDILLDVFEEAGIDRVFGNPGTTEFPLLASISDRPGWQYVLCLHDSVAVGAAHGFAMVTERPCLVNLHAAPGLANAMGNIYNAWKSGMPLVVTSGQVDTRLMMHEPPLWGDLITMVRPYVKWAHEVTRPEDAGWAAYRALQVAMTPPRGPVFLSLPMNVMDETVPRYERRLRPVSAVGCHSQADERAVRAAADLLSGALRPVIVSGEGVARSDAVPEVIELAELLGARVYGERVPPRVAFPHTHPLFCGSLGMSGDEIGRQLAGADVLLLAGAGRLVPIVGPEGWKLSAGTKVVQLDEDPWQVAKVFAVDTSMIGGVKSTLRCLVREVRARMADDARRTAAATRVAEIRRETEQARRLAQRELEAAWERKPIPVGRIARELQAVFPRDTIVVDEASSSSRALRTYYDFEAGDAYYGVKGTALGWGLPAAVGAAMGAPGRPVVAFLGDGATLYAPQALWTAARYGVPVTVIVNNNRGYGILKQGIQAYRRQGKSESSFVGMDIQDPAVDYISLARSFGVAAQRVVEPEDLRPALEWAQGRKAPSLIEVVVG